ncbi:hypothetical protein LIER_27238 [Lithospermum erythrorhizon]|uniref:Uncharacterized protein n=1 Tax=Lithospermum erythrorhizon TaxID=34254 RepID=A0AAV3RF94_LITER
MKGRDDSFNGKNVMGREPSSQLMCVKGIDEVENPKEDCLFNVHIDYSNYEVEPAFPHKDLDDNNSKLGDLAIIEIGGNLP